MLARGHLCDCQRVASSYRHAKTYVQLTVVGAEAKGDAPGLPIAGIPY